ncbi:tryptophan halogenase family protein [Colwelliaceae bacterium MEBiC 14330]
MPQPRNLVIVGGGTAGWMAAAAFSKIYQGTPLTITLIESEQLGTVGVGEATFPHLRFFNDRLGIDEKDFMRTTKATYKLGIKFVDWGQIGDNYMHAFGQLGDEINGLAFHHYWQSQQAQLNDSIFDYSLAATLAEKHKFEYPNTDTLSISSSFSYAFQLDANLYANYLREFSTNLGVKRVEGIINEVITDNNGDINKLKLDNGSVVSGDFFIDCSGFRGLLIEQTLQAGFEDWSHWLPCDRAVAVPCENTSSIAPYTQAKAQKAGWSWRIPLQSRTGNGHVYCSKYMSDGEAERILLNELQGKPLAKPKFLTFKTGRRKSTWLKNCVAIGLSSGFLEPLESTSIYLIQIAIMKLIEFFPADMATEDEKKQLRQAFNDDLALEYNRVKDFLILHYHTTSRNDSAFWRHCQNMNIPTSLKTKIDAFKESGYIMHYDQGLFLTPSWISVMIGQGMIPRSHHPLVMAFNPNEITQNMASLKQKIAQTSERYLDHHAFLTQNLALQNSEKDWPDSAMSLYGVFS